MKIGDRVFVRGYIDEIRKDTVIVRNDGGYFGTTPSEVTPSAQPEPSSEIQDILEYLDTVLHPIVSPDYWNVYSELHNMISMLSSAQPERTCVNCGRTINNGGWYADGRTRCPIEEHYALPKDGFCHLWEKRNVTDDDYPERRTDERTD